MSPRRSIVLFDIDGTLLRGAGLHHKQALVKAVMALAGVDSSLDGVATAGMLDRDLLAGMLQVHGRSARSIRALIGPLMRASTTHYLGECPADLSPFLCSGVVRMLEQLREAGAVLGLVSGNLSGIGWKKVELAGIRSYFSFGAFAEDGRSRARLAQVAAWRGKRIIGPAARISLVGDHLNDVEAARRNNFQAIAVASGVLSFEELALAKPDILVRHLGELDAARLVV